MTRAGKGTLYSHLYPSGGTNLTPLWHLSIPGTALQCPHTYTHPTAASMSTYLDPEALALLFVQQYLCEQGHSTGALLCERHACLLPGSACNALHARAWSLTFGQIPWCLCRLQTTSFPALAALEESAGIKYDDDKPQRGSKLMEVRTLTAPQNPAMHACTCQQRLSAVGWIDPGPLPAVVACCSARAKTAGVSILGEAADSTGRHHRAHQHQQQQPQSASAAATAAACKAARRAYAAVCCCRLSQLPSTQPRAAASKRAVCAAVAWAGPNPDGSSRWDSATAAV